MSQSCSVIIAENKGTSLLSISVYIYFYLTASQCLDQEKKHSSLQLEINSIHLRLSLKYYYSPLASKQLGWKLSLDLGIFFMHPHSALSHRYARSLKLKWIWECTGHWIKANTSHPKSILHKRSSLLMLSMQWWKIIFTDGHFLHYAIAVNFILYKVSCLKLLFNWPVFQSVAPHLPHSKLLVSWSYYA